MPCIIIYQIEIIDYLKMFYVFNNNNNFKKIEYNYDSKGYFFTCGEASRSSTAIFSSCYAKIQKCENIMKLLLASYRPFARKFITIDR